ncbi:unnamed protein product [Blepharisma stoltei]|uniref:Uncharacterized protein n=1 Tax=Blepharisma stoltei TaxID=1481888 RepID=A0AAU9K6U4_9CILI|nr:unnamed protein product [Blepharisma stoltei]
MIQEQRLLQFDLTKANWEDPSVKSQKIAGNVVFENSIDGGIQYDDPPQRSPGKTVNDSFKSYDMNESFASIREPSVLIQEYPQLPTINELEQLEDQKKSLSNRSTELTKQIDKLERDIENANHKLKFAQETELFYSPTGEGQCTIKHLFITLIIGFIIGYVFLG